MHIFLLLIQKVPEVKALPAGNTIILAGMVYGKQDAGRMKRVGAVKYLSHSKQYHSTRS